MEQRLSLITLGVGDIARSRRFYEALGWQVSGASQPGEVAFFPGGGVVLALWGRADLARDAALADAGGFGGVALAHNARTCYGGGRDPGGGARGGRARPQARR